MDVKDAWQAGSFGQTVKTAGIRVFFDIFYVHISRHTDWMPLPGDWDAEE